MCDYFILKENVEGKDQTLVIDFHVFRIHLHVWGAQLPFAPNGKRHSQIREKGKGDCTSFKNWREEFQKAK